jgi:hypothetical protein
MVAHWAYLPFFKTGRKGDVDEVTDLLFRNPVPENKFVTYSVREKNIHVGTDNNKQPVTIRFGGPVRVLWTSYDGSEDREISDLEQVKRFDGETCQDLIDGVMLPVTVADYLFDGSGTELLEGIGITGGIVRFEYKPQLKQLWLATEYYAPRKLNEQELDVLLDYTMGQWSDGAGESFCGELADKNDGVGPLCEPREIFIEQLPNSGMETD